MRYLIDGCYGDGNVGDECLLQALAEHVRRVDDDSRIVALSSDAQATEAETGLPAIQQCNPFGLNLYGSLVKGQLRQTLDAIRACDVFVLGGGELFRDDVGLTATLGILYRMRLARWLGKRVLALGVGAQAATTWWGRRILRGALRDAHVVLFRDQDSLRIACKLAPGLSTASCSPDLVFSLDWDRWRKPDGLARNGSDPLRIGIAVKSLPGSHPCFSDVHGRLPSTICQALSSVCQSRQCQIDVLPFAKSDLAIADALRGQLRRCGFQVAAPTSPEITPLQRAISQLDCLLAVPLHASVFAFACGVPAIGLSYDAKIPRLYQAVGIERLCLSVLQLKAADLEQRLRSVMEQRDPLRERLLAKAQRFGQAVRRAVDEALPAPRPSDGQTGPRTAPGAGRASGPPISGGRTANAAPSVKTTPLARTTQ